jgi:hypothetical protein
VAVRQSTEATDLESTAAQKQAAPLRFNKSDVREDMFGGPKPPDALIDAPRAQPAMQQTVPPPAPPDPIADAVYAGSMTVHGETSALIESRSTREGGYVAPGGMWQGIPVIAVSPGSVTLEVNGVERTLPISDTINVVQLSASAPGTPSGVVDQAQLDKKAQKAAKKAAKQLRAAMKKAEKQLKKQQKKAEQAMEEELSTAGNL